MRGSESVSTGIRSLNQFTSMQRGSHDPRSLSTTVWTAILARSIPANVDEDGFRVLTKWVKAKVAPTQPPYSSACKVRSSRRKERLRAQCSIKAIASVGR